MNSKLWNFFAIVLFTYSVFIAGASFADNQVADGVLNLILAALWGTILLGEWVMRGRELKALRKIDRLMDRLFHDMARAIERVESEEANKKKPAKQGKGKIKGAVAKKPVTKKGNK